MGRPRQLMQPNRKHVGPEWTRWAQRRPLLKQRKTNTQSILGITEERRRRESVSLYNRHRSSSSIRVCKPDIATILLNRYRSPPVL
jgi:hypothetical protein